MTEQATEIPFGLEPMSRNPVEYPYGFFIGHPARFGGSQGFLWFDSEEAALAYLGGSMVGVTALKQLSAPMCVPANLESVLAWAGELDDLVLGDGKFERGVRADFWNHYGKVNPMDESYGLFAEHLASYQG